jgi:hypothetical protein
MPVSSIAVAGSQLFTKVLPELLELVLAELLELDAPLLVLVVEELDALLELEPPPAPELDEALVPPELEPELEVEPELDVDPELELADVLPPVLPCAPPLLPLPHAPRAAAAPMHEITNQVALVMRRSSSPRSRR